MTLRFEVANDSAMRWGFEAVMPFGDGSPAGTIPAPSLGATWSRIPGLGGREYAGHDGDNGGTFRGQASVARWDVEWDPPTDGDIVVHACANAANDRDDTSGDQVNCATFTLAPLFPPTPAILRACRLTAPSLELARLFATQPCTRSGEVGICAEAAGNVEDHHDAELPQYVRGDGALVFLAFDSDPDMPGTPDVIHVSEDPATPGNLLVR